MAGLEHCYGYCLQCWMQDDDVVLEVATAIRSETHIGNKGLNQRLVATKLKLWHMVKIICREKCTEQENKAWVKIEL